MSILLEWTSVSKQPSPFQPMVFIYDTAVSAVVRVPLFMPSVKVQFQFSELARLFA